MDRRLQLIARRQKSYIKDPTDLINFVERAKIHQDTIIVSMDVASLYTNIPTKPVHLIHLLKQFGELLIFEWNYAIKDLPTMPTFYRELLFWWSEFPDHFFEEKYWLSIIWNNKDLRIKVNLFFTKRITTPESAVSMICY